MMRHRFEIPEEIADQLRLFRALRGRLRLVYQPAPRKSSRGRRPKATGLLVALDAICLHGIEWSGPGRTGTPREIAFQRGPRWKPIAEAYGMSHADSLLKTLDRRWALSANTLRDHVKRNRRNASKLLTVLLGLPWDPPVMLSEIQYALAEHWPIYREASFPPPEPGLAFNIASFVRAPA